MSCKFICSNVLYIQMFKCPLQLDVQRSFKLRCSNFLEQMICQCPSHFDKLGIYISIYKRPLIIDCTIVITFQTSISLWMYIFKLSFILRFSTFNKHVNLILPIVKAPLLVRVALVLIILLFIFQRFRLPSKAFRGMYPRMVGSDFPAMPLPTWRAPVSPRFGAADTARNHGAGQVVRPMI